MANFRPVGYIKKHLKMSSDRQIIAPFQEISVAESSDVRSLTGRSEVGISVHAQYKLAKNSPERLPRCRTAFEFQCIAIATFY